MANLNDYLREAQNSLKSLEENWQNIQQSISENTEELQQEANEKVEAMRKEFSQIREQLTTAITRHKNNYVSGMIAEDKIEEEVQNAWNDMQSNYEGYSQQIKERLQKAENQLDKESQAALANWQNSEANIHFKDAMQSLSKSFEKFGDSVESRVKSWTGSPEKTNES